MKKMLFILVFIAGCQQQNLTWTPTPEEWASMTPEQRNTWTANEMRARQVRDGNWQRFLDGFKSTPNPSYNEQKEIERIALDMARRDIIAHDLGIEPTPCHNCPYQEIIDISSPNAYEREATGVGAVRNLWPW